MQYFLGIDGGASKTEVVCLDYVGNFVGRGTAGPTNLISTFRNEAIDNLNKAISLAVKPLASISDVGGVVMGLSGLDTIDEKKLAHESFGNTLTELVGGNWKIVNDSWVALRSGTERKNAIVLIAGTGSNCTGRNSQGKTATVGAMDSLLSDEGSGFFIGRRVLRSVVQSYDGRGPKTLLEKLILDHFEINSVLELKSKIYHPRIKKSEVAALAKLCFFAKEEDDQVATRICQKVVDDLQHMVITVARRLELGQSHFDLVMVGGINKSFHIRVPLINSLQVIFPDIDIIYPDKTPAFGAAQLARETL